MPQAVEGVTLRVTDCGVAALARCAAEMNSEVENIGARRLRTVIATVMEDVSFKAHSMAGQEVVVDANFVDRRMQRVGSSATDLKKYLL